MRLLLPLVVVKKMISSSAHTHTLSHIVVQVVVVDAFGSREYIS